MSVLEFFDAVTDNNTAKLSALLKEGYNPNAILDDDRLTPLHFAVIYDACDAAALLIDNGANINAKDFEGRTALDWALSGLHKSIAKLLVSRTKPNIM